MIPAHNEPLLSDLKVFCTVVRCGSFIGTAAELGASPAFVSKRIAVLEGQLGVKLFHRTTRRMVLSTDGEMVYRSARKMLDDMAALGDSIASNRHEPSGSLRVSTSPRVGRSQVSRVLSLLAKRYPQLDIWLELADRAVDLIGEGFDIDIRVGEPPQQQLIAHQLARGGRIVCAAPSYLQAHGEPGKPEDLLRHQCLVARYREQGLGIWRLVGPRGAESVKVHGRFGSNQGEVVLDWAIEGHGIVLLSEWDVAAEIADGRLVRLLRSYHEPADLWAMTSTRAANSAKINACVAFLKQHLAHGPHALLSTIQPPPRSPRPGSNPD